MSAWHGDMGCFKSRTEELSEGCSMTAHTKPWKRNGFAACLPQKVAVSRSDGTGKLPSEEPLRRRCAS